MKYFLLGVLLLYGCHNRQQVNTVVIGTKPVLLPVLELNATDTCLQCKNGYWYYKGLLLSGTVHEQYTSGKPKRIQSFFEGKEQGWLLTYFPNGQPESKRYYTLGEKDSLHTGWWPNGNKRFETGFRLGLYNGHDKEWYADGRPLKDIMYVNGTDICGQGWRSNGKLYMNFANRNGRRYGLMNAQLCYSVKDKRGSYIQPAVTALK